MRPLRLTKQTWAVVAEWAGEQGQGNQRLALEFLRALIDGSWIEEFDNVPANTEVVTVFLAPRVPAYMTIHEERGVEHGSVFTIEHDPGPEPLDTGEKLGVEPEPEPGLDDEGRRPPEGPAEMYPEPNEDADAFAKRLEEFRRTS
jgi:hypothetical protein